MFELICGLLAMLITSLTSSALAGELRHEALYSPALARYLPYVIYLPTDYEQSRSRYPVVYLLHGAGGDENSWSVNGHITEHFDRLVAAGTLPPAILVMPGCPGCWWVDGARDKGETAFWQDLIPKLSLRFRTIESRDGRVVIGLSAGGYGAIRFGLKYPDRVCAVAALSPAIYVKSPPQTSAARSQPPFQKSDGTFDQTSWDHQNYPALLDGYNAQSDKVAMYLVSGDHDRFGIAFETALFFKVMFEKQAALTELRVIEGDHTWKIWNGVVDDALKYVFKFVRPGTEIARRAVEPAQQLPRR